MLPTYYDTFFIDGVWARPKGTDVIHVVSPATEEIIGSVPSGTSADMDSAVLAARRAFDEGPWPRMSLNERTEILLKIAAYLEEKGPDLARLISSEMGSPLKRLAAAAPMPALLIKKTLDMAKVFPFVESRQGMVGDALIVREPVGVVGGITPWNGPLHLLMMKFAPALVAGCTFVSKPSPEAPLDAYVLAAACEAAGLPRGVFNLVPGGRELGEHLVTHPGVDKISFTGSTTAGRRIAELCGRDMRRFTLELGGKSAAVALSDADPKKVASHAVARGLAFNSGQACAALTRVIVPRARQQEFVDAMVAEIDKLVTGDPSDPQVDVGPMVAERQRDRVESYIAAGLSEGARLVRGGGRPDGLERGWFVEPTLFSDATNDMKIAREEIFGPVGVIIPYDGGDEEAIALANDTPYGLAGAVFTEDASRGIAAARRIRAGTMGCNTFFIDPLLPFGGFKSSGVGRENGPEGIAIFTEIKTLQGVALQELE
ncbi:aldehyde dehydrogenase [Pseudomonas sp. NFX224]|uniref:aldehyde dehydrogenase n=1 Tax=Pseudomonas sp. NFX224 TaxID=3402862 RepID=UPI003AFB6D4B